EAEALSTLNHNNIVRFHNCWVADKGGHLDNSDDSCSTSHSGSSSNSPGKYLYIQMELCEAKTLENLIYDWNEVSPQNSKRRKEALDIALQIISAVKYIHSKMLIHRDLKPANIMFGPDGVVKIGDFGLVTEDNDDDAEDQIQRSKGRGTLSYMAPEQSEMTYDRKVDVFSSGLIFFELFWEIKTVHEKDKLMGLRVKAHL
uniref:Protein kinase domain-containing protein n=1 Tax=Echeneis naucrates TaxID=173247 RepID=A0A665WI80_ECHNA